MVKSRFLEQWWNFKSMVPLNTTVDFLHYLHFEPLSGYLTISPLLFSISSYLQVWKKLNYASARVMLDLFSYMICHVTALVVISTAIFKGDTSLAPLFLTTWKCLNWNKSSKRLSSLKLKGLTLTVFKMLTRSFCFEWFWKGCLQ